MNRLILIFLFVLSVPAFAYKAEFPTTPVLDLTPGSLCERPSQYRYPEQIPYCNRDVNREVKEEIFREYRRQGYRLNLQRREDYKIDHYIPLCAGGSNDEDNFWPQHVSVFSITDPLEFIGCEKLKIGKITQAHLVKLIKKAKNDLTTAPETLSFLRSL
jgi:hypothetical protein